MVQPARSTRFGDEPSGRVLLTHQVRVDDLDGDRSAEVRLFGAVHAPHSTDPDEIENDVAAGERSTDERIVRRDGNLADRKTARWAELVRLFALVLALRTLPHALAPREGRYHAEKLPETEETQPLGSRCGHCGGLRNNLSFFGPL
jgi:hypothetical protein